MGWSPWIRAACTSLFLGLGCAPAEAGELPSSLVDYLRSTSRDIRMEARSLLFARYRPGERYTGSAVQNIFLRNALVADDHAPRLEQTERLFREGEAIRLKVTRPATRMDSELKAVCEDVAGATEIDVGPAKVGIFGIRLVGEHAAAEGVLLVAPSGDGLGVVLLLDGQPLLSGNRATEQLAAATNKSELSVKEMLERLPGALERFGSKLGGAPIRQSFRVAARAWLQKPGNMAAAATTGAVCTVWAGATLSPIPGASRATWGFCWDSIKDPGRDLLFDVMAQVVQDTPDLEDADKRALQLFFESLKTAIDVFDLASIRNDSRAVEALEKSLAGVLIIADQIEEGPIKIMLQVFGEAGKKHVVAIKVLRTLP